MQTLMISLDKNILDKNSMAAKRMVVYGKKSDLFIIIPDNQKQNIELSRNVKVYSTGGDKLQQFFQLKQLGKKIIKENKIDLITAQDPFFTGLIGVCLKMTLRHIRGKPKIKLEVQLHGDFFSSDYYKKSGMKNLMRYYLAKLWVIKKADKIRVVGERIKQSLLKLGVEENKIETRSIAIDAYLIENYQPKINLHAKYSSYKKIFLNIGRLDTVKNIDFLIDVFTQAITERNDYLLLIVGAGAEKNNLQNKVKSLGLENNIKFEPWKHDPIDYIKTADCVLFPSFSEGYGLVPMEASVVGTKVIMSNVGVANFELKPSDKVKILPLDTKRWAKEITNII